MRAICILILVLLLTLPISAAAGDGTIFLSSQPGTINGELEDRAPGICSYYVIHSAVGVTRCEFSLPAPSCFAGTYLSDTIVFPSTNGNSQGSVSVGYGACRSGDIHILTVNFMCAGQTGDCCTFPVSPIVGARTVFDIDCNAIMSPANSQGAVVNVGPACALPTEESTWGHIKELFRE